MTPGRRRRTRRPRLWWTLFALSALPFAWLVSSAWITYQWVRPTDGAETNPSDNLLVIVHGGTALWMRMPSLQQGPTTVGSSRISLSRVPMVKPSPSPSWSWWTAPTRRTTFGPPRTTIESSVWHPFLVAAVVTGVLAVRDSRRPKPGTCEVCGYALADLTADRCPECGEPVPSTR
ncbi:MAG: hypothetical protein R3B49_00335 [Phycisphaerales bacterium]